MDRYMDYGILYGYMYIMIYTYIHNIILYGLWNIFFSDQTDHISFTIFRLIFGTKWRVFYLSESSVKLYKITLSIFNENTLRELDFYINKKLVFLYQQKCSSLRPRFMTKWFLDLFISHQIRIVISLFRLCWPQMKFLQVLNQ